MDPSRLCTDNQTRPPAALADCPTRDLGSSSAHSPTEKIASALETDAETESELSGATEKSTETSANFSKLLSQERSIDSDFFRTLLCSNIKSECLSFCLESTPRDDEHRVDSYFGPSEPVLPLLTHGLISRHSESELYFTEPTLSFSLMQEINTFQPVLSSTSEGVMEPFVSEASSSCTFNSVTSLLRSDSLESDTATASLTDLYIFEGKTPDVILSPDVDPQEIKCPRYQSFSLTGGTKDHPECYTHDSMCDSGNVVMQCCPVKEQVMLDYESGMRQHKMPAPPAVDACEAGSMSGNDAAVTDLTPHLKRSNSPIELWLDSCQYLADEDSENRGVLDNNSGPTVMQGGLTATSDLSFPTRETLVSGYSPDGGEGIGWSNDDTVGRGPPVERWSSVDSWTSALSDWTEIITSPPQDLTAAFTEIGAEIDALTQALAEVNALDLDTEASKGGEGQGAVVRARQQPPMGVQDHPLKAQSIPETTVLSGQRCLSLCLEAAGHEKQDRDSSEKVESFCATTPSTLREKDPEDVQSSQDELPLRPTYCCPYVGSSSAERCNGGTLPESTSAVLNLSHFGGCVESFETDIFISNEEDPVILNIIEDMDMDGPKAPIELIIEEPFADGLCEVTDESNRPVSQPVVKQDANRSLEPADRGGTNSSTDHLLATSIPTDSQVQSVDKRPGLNANAQSVSQVQPQCGRTEFILPVAPLGVGSPRVCQTNRSFRDQTCVKRSLNDHKTSCIPWPATDEVTVKCSLAENDKELINKKESSEKPSPQGPLALEPTKHFFTERKAVIEDIHELSKVLSNITAAPSDHFVVSETSRIAVITLDLNDPFAPRATKPFVTAVESEKTDLNTEKTGTMPHKTYKFTSESRTRSKKEKSAGHPHGAQAAKKQENLCHLVSAQPVCKGQETPPLTDGNQTRDTATAGPEDKEAKLVVENGEATEKVPTKPHSKKKKKHAQNETGVKGGVEPLAEVEKGAKPKTAKGRIEKHEAKLLGVQAGKAQKDGDHPRVAGLASWPPEAEVPQGEQPPQQTGTRPTGFTSPLNDDVKRRRLSENKFGKIFGVFESKLPKTEVLLQSKGEEAKADAGETPRKAYSDVVKQKVPPKEEPKVVKSIQVAAVSADPQSLCLWCQFSAVFCQHTVTWSRDGAVVAEIKRSAGDESRVSLIISNASHKDLGKYQCRLTSLHGSVTLDYLLTYEVLSEIVIPPSPKTISTVAVEVRTEEEDVQCSRLIFKEDFLSDQYFGENQPVSIITEKVHFGEGMHRRAFRTKLHAGQISLLLPGHSCVLKVHNAISYGTNNNDELIQKNFTLAVEECQVQNTAREYIKAYTTAAQSFESFGEIPEIIPIYLVHRPSNDIPYATLEEELIGDFVKYSVKDGKEINLMRRDSEAGQKCCAFQHWVYHKTEGNLLVTDMQGVGMRLTDVGIATSKKGYQGFKGNCATSFIDQFKVLHQCNKYCEILGLKSLQPKAKKHASALKPKPQPSASPKKKTFGPTMKGKS